MTQKFGENGSKREAIMKTEAAKSRMRRGPSLAFTNTQKTPLNIIAMFRAVGSQDASSKLIPMAPRRSARPTLSRRLFMVAMLAPRNTPRTPTYGFVKICAGALGGDAGAASFGVAVLTGFAPELFRASAPSNPCNDPYPSPQCLLDW